MIVGAQLLVALISRHHNQQIQLRLFSNDLM